MGLRETIEIMDDLLDRSSKMETAIADVRRQAGDLRTQAQDVGRELAGVNEFLDGYTAQLKSGAATWRQIQEDWFGAELNFASGLKDLDTAIAKSQQLQQDLQNLAGKFVSNKATYEDMLAAFQAGDPRVAKAIEDVAKLSKNALEAAGRYRDLAKTFANKDKGGSALATALEALAQKALAGDLAEILGGGLTGGKL